MKNRAIATVYIVLAKTVMNMILKSNKKDKI